MKFKSILNESQIQLGIERISKKLYRTRSERDKLDELAQQMIEINREKKHIRNEFQSKQQIGSIQVGIEATVLQELLNELRISNSLKELRVQQAIEVQQERKKVREDAPIMYHQTLEDLQTLNRKTLAKIDRDAEIEEGSFEGLQFMHERLSNDVKILRKKIDKLAWYRAMLNKNLAKITNSQLQIRFKKVFATGLLQNQAYTVDEMLKQHYEVVRHRQAVLDKQKEEMTRLEGECALISIKINDATALNSGLSNQLRRIDRSGSIIHVEETKKVYIRHIERKLEELVSFLTTKSSLLLKRQLLICIEHLLKDSSLIEQDKKTLFDLKQELIGDSHTEPPKLLISLNSMSEDGKDEKDCLTDNYTFGKSMIYRNAIYAVKDKLLQMPSRLIVLLIGQYYLRLKESCDYQYHRFADLHDQWMIKAKSLKKQTDCFHNVFCSDMSCNKINDLNNPITNSEIEKSLTRLSQSLEAILKIRVFIFYFAIRIKRILAKVNKLCSNLQYKFQSTVLCPFDLKSNPSSEDSENNSNMTLENISNVSVKNNARQTTTMVLNQEIWDWMCKRVPFLQVQRSKDCVIPYRKNSINIGFRLPSYSPGCKQIYELALIDIQEFALYIANILTEFEKEKQRAEAGAEIQDWNDQHIYSSQQVNVTIPRRDFSKKEANIFNFQREPSYALKGKILSQSK